MASASFGCAGHVRPALWTRGCYCRYKIAGVSVLLCQTHRFLALLRCCSRSTASMPSVGLPHSTLYTQDWHLLPAVVLSAPVPVLHLFNFPGHTGRLTGEKVHTFKLWGAQAVVTACILKEATLFFKSICGLSFKALFDCISSIGRVAQKVNNQF